MRRFFLTISELLEGQNENLEKKYDRRLTRHVDAMSHRPTLKRYIYVLGSLNLLLWLAVIIRPFDVLTAFQKLASVDDRLIAAVLIALLAVGMWLTYAVFRIKFPDLEDRNYATGFMSNYAYHLNWNRKFRVWITSVSGGVINLLALAITEGLLVSN